MRPDTDLQREIQMLLVDKLMLEVESPEIDLLQTGMLDSLKLVELLFHLEQHFGFNVAIEELDTEDFRSIHSITRLVARGRTLERVSGD